MHVENETFDKRQYGNPLDRFLLQYDYKAPQILIFLMKHERALNRFPDSLT